MATNGKLQLDGYIRVSKIGGRKGEGFIAPATQREQITSYANVLGGEIAQWHEDLDYSGTNTDRPEFQAMLDRFERGETDGIVAARLDRFSRNAVDGGTIAKRIVDAGGVFATAAERIDSTTPTGKAMVMMMFVMAELTTDNIRSGWQVATASAIARGIHPHDAFGYMDRPAKASTPLTANPATEPLVVEVFERRARGESWAAIARFLDGKVSPPRGGKQWTRRTVENIVKNRVYLGEAFYGSERKRGAHPALIGLDLFEAAQHARGVRPSRGEPALLSGLVRCAGCRHRMRVASVGSRRQRVYRCDRSHGSGDCPAPASVSAELLDEHVERVFLERYGDVALEGRRAEAGIAEAKEALADAEAEVAAFLESESVARLRDELPDHFESALQSKMDAVREARGALDAARSRAGGVDVSASLDVWPSLTTEERRRVLAAGLDTVFLRRAGRIGRPPSLDDDRARILWRGEAPDDLPGPGRRVELRSFDW
jgi:site-specific DNA recombinase